MKARCQFVVSACMVVMGCGAARADISINFEVDASGQPISAPAAFDNAGPLRDAYAAWGVHFSGPTSAQGGAVLNDSTFALPARSGHNMLALSGIEPAEFGGPETISFDSPVYLVSIYASGIGHPYTFTMQAFDAGGTLLDSTSLLTAGFGRLTVSSSTGIRRVVLSAPSAGVNTYVYDDLFASTSAPACYANCDASTTSPALNVLDFACFLNRFAAGDSYANCDGSTTPPVLNVLDFSCFLNRFAAGCP